MLTHDKCLIESKQLSDSALKTEYEERLAMYYVGGSLTESPPFVTATHSSASTAQRVAL